VSGSERDSTVSGHSPAEPAETQPILRVIDAHATPEEVAAIVAVFSALGGGAPAPQRRRSTWASPARAVGRPLTHGAGAWRASGLPR
jgi:hypothetical protein